MGKPILIRYNDLPTGFKEYIDAAIDNGDVMYDGTGQGGSTIVDHCIYICGELYHLHLHHFSLDLETENPYFEFIKLDGQECSGCKHIVRLFSFYQKYKPLSYPDKIF